MWECHPSEWQLEPRRLLASRDSPYKQLYNQAPEFIIQGERESQEESNSSETHSQVYKAGQDSIPEDGIDTGALCPVSKLVKPSTSLTKVIRPS